MKKVIVTGATGTLGVSLIKNLIKKNIEVLAILNINSKRIENVPKSEKVKIIKYDMKDYDKIENTDNKKYDVLYHFAWNGTFGRDRDDKNLQDENIKNSVKTVYLAKRFGCGKIIFAGSQAEYGIKNEKLKVEMAMHPITEYGRAKLIACEKTKEVAKTLGIKHIWVRILSLYGPYDGEKTLVMSLIKNLIEGKEFNLTKCEQVWDYLYSEDAADLFIKIAEKINDNKIYVIGSGDNRVLKDYVEDIKSVVNEKGKLNYGAIPYNEQQVLFLSTDSSEVKKDLDWCKKTEFKEGIKKILKENFRDGLWKRD